jgi:hypothetical protein
LYTICTKWLYLISVEYDDRQCDYPDHQN